MSPRKLLTNLLITLMLATAVGAGAGCATSKGAPALGRVPVGELELTLHDVDAVQAARYVEELKRTGRYRNIRLRMESPGTARILATSTSTATR